MLFSLIALFSACGLDNKTADHATELSNNPIIPTTSNDSIADKNETIYETFDIPLIFHEDAFLQVKYSANRPFVKPLDRKEFDNRYKQKIEALLTEFFVTYNDSLNSKTDADLSVFYDLSTINRIWDYRLNQAALYSEIQYLVANETQSELIDVVIDSSNWNNGNGYIVAFPLEKIEARTDVDTISNTIEHEFVLIMNEDEMKIIRHRIYSYQFAAVHSFLIKRCQDIDDMDAIKKLIAEDADKAKSELLK